MTGSTAPNATTTPESTALSKDLRRRGSAFVGPTTAYPAMQAMGIVDAHAHMFTNYGFGGGGIFHGSPFHRLGVEHALGSCAPFHGDEGRRDLVGFAFSALGPEIDTNALLWENTTYGNQTQWLPQAMMEVEGKDWVFLAGHHPYRSNDINWCGGASTQVYHCSTALLVGLALEGQPEK